MKEQCRNCIHFDKIKGSKSKNTDFGTCKKMENRILNRENKENSKNIYIYSSADASINLDLGVYLELYSDSINKRLHFTVDGDFYCANYTLF